MTQFYDLVRAYTATTGTGTLTVGSAVAGFIGFHGVGSAGIPDGATISYAIEDGTSRETGTGTFTLSSTTLTRNVAYSTNFNTLTGVFQPISLSGNAQVFITMLAQDVNRLEAATNFVPQVGLEYIELYFGGVWTYTLSSVTVYDTNGTAHTPTSVTVGGSVETLPWSATLSNGYVSVVCAFATPIVPSSVDIAVTANVAFPAPWVISGSSDGISWSSLGTITNTNFAGTAELYQLTYPTTNYAETLGQLADVDLSTPPTSGQVLTYESATHKWVPGAGGSMADFLSYATGITADGTTDTAALLSGAISAAAAGVLELQQGVVYAISAGLTVSANGLTIQGNGATLKKIGSSPFNAITITGNGNKIVGLNVEGNSIGGAGIWITGSDNIVEGCSSYGNASHGLGMDGQTTTCTGNVVIACRSYSNTGIGISQNHTTGNRIANNHIYSNTDEGVTADNQSNNAVIVGNVLDGNGSGGVGNIGIDYATGVVVTSNIIENAPSGIPGICFQNNLGNSSECVVTGNTFNNNAGGGVHLKTNSAHTTSDCIVIGNVFDSVGTSVVVDAGSNSNVIYPNIFGSAFSDAGTGTVSAYGGGSISISGMATVQLSRQAAFSIPNATWTTLSFDTVDMDDTGAAVNLSTSPTLITVPPGYSRARAFLTGAYANNSTGARTEVIVGAGANLAVNMHPAINESGYTLASGMIPVVAGNTFFVNAIQTSGGALNTSTPSTAFLAVTLTVELYGNSGSGGTDLTLTAGSGSYGGATVSGFVSAARTGGSAIGALSSTAIGSNTIEAVYTSGSTVTAFIANGTSSAISGITGITVPGVGGELLLANATATFISAYGYWSLVWSATGSASTGTLVIT